MTPTRPIASRFLRRRARIFLKLAFSQRAFDPHRARACYLACKLCLRRSRDPFFV